MIGAHATGIEHSYKKIKKMPAQCLVCGEYSECQILKYEKARHIFYFKVKILDEQFIFDWANVITERFYLISKMLLDTNWSK